MADAMASVRLSGNPEWSTPQYVFDALDREFGFTLDVCATQENAKCRRFFDKKADGLSKDWTGICWMNPPYGRSIRRWVRKARESAEAGAIVVGLVPARTDTAWWQDCMRASEIRFVRGRLRFGDAEAGAPFPSAIVIWGTPRVPVITVTEFGRDSRWSTSIAMLTT